MKNIIVVDDNPVILEKYKSLFSKRLPDVTVEYYQNANDALERVTRNGFDLLIVDYNLGHKEINGMDIARLTYALGKPIFVISKHKIITKAIILCRYMDMLKTVTFIDKPVNDIKLIDKIKGSLSQPVNTLTNMFRAITGINT